MSTGLPVVEASRLARIWNGNHKFYLLGKKDPREYPVV